MQSQALVQFPEITALQFQENRNEAIIEITQEISELHGLFRQLGELVTEQTPLISHIESQAETIVQNLQNANEQLSESLRKKEKANRWKCWLLIILIIFVLVLVLLLKIA